MPLAEPVTVLTDYVLAAVALVLGTALLRSGSRARALWGGAMLATAVAAAVGGTEHGLRPRLDPSTAWWLWEVTYVAVGLANFLLLAGAACAVLSASWRRLALGLLGLRFAAFVALLTMEHDFAYVIGDFAVTLLALALLAGWASRRALPWAGPLAGAVALSVAGAAAQHLRLAPHPHFNHNDLFHVLQAVGVVLYHRAGVRLGDPDAGAAHPPDGTTRSSSPRP